MVSTDTQSVIHRAKALYDQQLRNELEKRHLNHFVAIEPDSGEYFISDSFDKAVKLARASHPTKLTFTVRIGSNTAFHIGVMDK